MKIERVNIGVLIKNKVTEKKISFAAFSKSIGIQRQNIAATIFEKNSIDTERLSLICEILDYNFFSHYKDLEERNKENYINEIKEVKASVTIQIGQEEKEETFTFVFGKNK